MATQQDNQGDVKSLKGSDLIVYDEKATAHDFDNEYENFPEPTKEDWKELPEVADSIPKSAYLVILIELCERFTYYGLSGPFQNYIQFPSPPSYPADQPGALGKGHQTATALNLFFQFWCYITPIIGAVVADQYLGKYRTILLFACIYMVGLLILTCTAVPSAISSGAAFPGFIVSIIIIGLGTGGIKSNVSPLIAEQYRSRKPFIRTEKNGRRVIVTPQATYQKLFNYFYWGINVGSLSAIATTEMEKNLGFWPAYLLPTCMFVIGIVVVLAGRKQYVQAPPRGSIFVEAGKLLVMRFRVKGGLDACKPSKLQETRPDLLAGVTWDDVFVDEIRRTLRACVVFCWYPIYWVCYNQITTNLVSMAANMETGNVPNDIMQNIDPICLIIFIPIMDKFVYPLLRRFGFHMRPIMRITLGFLFASIAMAYTAGIYSMLYNSPPYYNMPEDNVNYISAAYQIPSYCFIAFSEIFASITGLEYAYKKAPQSMKSIVMALFLLTNCFGAVLGFALVSVSVDPYIEWMYTGIAGASFVTAILVYVCHIKNDRTDVEDDSIGRDEKELEDYQRTAATVDYEVTKNAA